MEERIQSDVLCGMSVRYCLRQALQMDEGNRTRVRYKNLDACRTEDIGIRHFGENSVMLFYCRFGGYDYVQDSNSFG